MRALFKLYWLPTLLINFCLASLYLIVIFMKFRNRQIMDFLYIILKHICRKESGSAELWQHHYGHQVGCSACLLICAIKQVSPWGCHLWTLMRTGWDLCPDKPFNLQEVAVDTSYPIPAATVATARTSESSSPIFSFPSTFQVSLHKESTEDVWKNVNVDYSFWCATENLRFIDVGL